MPLSAGTAFITILPDMTGFVAGIQRGVAGMSSKISSVGATLTKRLTFPIVGAGVAAIKLASDFETSMNHIVGLVGVSREQVDKWADDILGLAKELPQSPNELAEALFFVTSAGFRGESAMRVLEASARAAAAGLGETKTVADAVTSAVNAYGEDVLSAADATDILTNAVRLGKAEASSIAPVLGSILPTASELGVSFNDVAAAIAAMTRTGDSAATAATKTNAIFSSMTKVTKQQEEAFAKAGFTAAELRKSLAERGLLPTLIDLKEATGGNVAELAKMFPNVRALRGVLSLTGKQVDENSELFKDMANSAGIADEAFNSVRESAEFKLKSALSSLQATAIKFGAVLLPIVAKAAELFGKLFDFIGDLSPHMRNLVLIVLGLAAAIGPLIFIFGKLLLLLSPVGLVITAIALAVYALVRNWKTVEPVVMPIINKIREAITRAWDAVRSLDWKQLMKTITGTLNSVARVISNVIGDAVRWFKRAWDATETLRVFIAEIAKEVLEGLLNAFKSLGDVWKTAIIPALANLRDAFKALWDPVLKAVFIVIGAIIGALLIFASKALPVVIRLLGTLIRWLSKLILFIAKVIQFVGRLIGWFIKAGVKIVQAVGHAIGAIIRWFRDLPGTIARFISSIPSKVASFFVDMARRSLESASNILNWFRDLPGKAAAFLVSLPIKIGEAFRRMANAIIGWWNRIDLRIDFRLPDVKFVPGLDGQHITTPDLIPDVPFLARGGVVLTPTLAVIGERGPEAVVPLDQFGLRGSQVIEIIDSNLGLVMHGVVREDRAHQDRIGRMRR